MSNYIFGAGKLGKILLKELMMTGTPVTAFLQNERPDGGSESVSGISVKSMADIKKLNGDSVVFLAISNEQVVRLASDRLIKAGVLPTHIIDARDFIKANDLDLDRKKYCIACGRWSKWFLSTGCNYPIFDKLKVCGGGIRPEGRCPVCSSIDRERWVIYVLANHTDMLSSKCSVLHFAPESHVSELVKANKLCSYITGDIEPGRAMCMLDITDINFRDNTFDYVIANHVLEHIPDMEKAINELKRVLKPDGKIVLSFPICHSIKTREDKNVVTDEERIRLYGQKDHVRLFGYDYADILEDMGLNVSTYSPKEELSVDMIETMGMIPDDTVLICAKTK